MMDYKSALENSPIWIQKAWMEFNKLPKQTQAKTPFLYFILGKGKGTPPFKISKADSNYKDPSSNKDFICGNCIFYYVNPVKKIAVCSQIRGNVDYDAICRLWVGESSIEK
jgi:hypothetical protein